jgi:hypothetical protein
MEGLDHVIHKPREIAVDDGPSGLGSMEIVDSDRRRQIVKLMEPLLLPPAEERSVGGSQTMIKRKFPRPMC